MVKFKMNQTKKVGRPAGKVEYKDVEYDGKSYTVCTVYRNSEPIQFVFDKDDEEKVKSKFWHCTSVGYIASSSKEKSILLHRFILNKLDFPGKGTTISVDHINRNPLDNRKENLRIISQTEQNLNQKKKPRNIVQLPENCGINSDDIPKHVWYIKSNKSHGDRFAIEFKTENIIWKTTSSKKVSLLEKLNEAKQKLLEFYKEYPYLDPNNPEKVYQENKLNESFEKIIGLYN
jgi:hypothetical protein